MKRISPALVAALSVAAGLGGPIKAGQISLLPGYSSPAPQLKAGTQAPQGGIGSILGALIAGRGFGGGSVWRPRYIGRGYTVAHGRRMAAKRRNRLRAKGQFRKAVR